MNHSIKRFLSWMNKLFANIIHFTRPAIVRTGMCYPIPIQNKNVCQFQFLKDVVRYSIPIMAKVWRIGEWLGHVWRPCETKIAILGPACKMHSRRAFGIEPHTEQNDFNNQIKVNLPAEVVSNTRSSAGYSDMNFMKFVRSR